MNKKTNKNIKKTNKNIKKTNTKKNSKKDVNNCMKTFVKKKVAYWTEEINKQIKDLENKNLTKDEKKLLSMLKKQRKDQQNNLEKQYKLYNCNINCKNTLLEPGPPNQIPKSMYKVYDNNKQLIKIFNDQRSNIFKNKKNVLIGNFYEKTPKKMKNDLLKEGAISQCIPL